MPTYDEHVQWFNQAIINEKVAYIIQFMGNDAGFISVSLNTESEYEINWYVIPIFQNRGIGTSALKVILRCFEKRPLVGYVNIENQASQKSFAKAGFVKREENCCWVKND